MARRSIALLYRKASAAEALAGIAVPVTTYCEINCETFLWWHCTRWRYLSLKSNLKLDRAAAVIVYTQTFNLHYSQSAPRLIQSRVCRVWLDSI